jgi:hypothetical protein
MVRGLDIRVHLILTLLCHKLTALVRKESYKGFPLAGLLLIEIKFLLLVHSHGEVQFMQFESHK